MSMIEPLPPIDMQRFTREIESFFWDWLYATKSKHAEWWERCTGQMWMKFLSIARRYSVPMTLELLRMFRATFLYDSIAMRLHNDLDMNGEFKNYVRERGVRAKRKVRRNFRRRIDKGLGDTDYLAIERTARLGTQVLNRVQYLLDSPNHRFFDMLGKAAFAVRSCCGSSPSQPAFTSSPSLPSPPGWPFSSARSACHPSSPSWCPIRSTRWGLHSAFWSCSAKS